MEEFEWQEQAEGAISELRGFIVAEEQIVLEEHALMDKLNSWDYVFAHLDERIPKESPLHAVSAQITDKLLEIRNFVEVEFNANLQIIKEEQETLQKLEAAIGHREWQLVKPIVKEEATEEEKAVRLTKQEIRALHTMFIDLMRIIKSSENIKLPENLAKTQAKEEFEKIEMYYYTEIYKFARAYERILRQLWEKERILLGEIKKRI